MIQFAAAAAGPAPPTPPCLNSWPSTNAQCPPAAAAAPPQSPAARGRAARARLLLPAAGAAKDGVTEHACGRLRPGRRGAGDTGRRRRQLVPALQDAVRAHAPTESSPTPPPTLAGPLRCSLRAAGCRSARPWRTPRAWSTTPSPTSRPTPSSCPGAAAPPSRAGSPRRR